ncbi:MAG: PQQ-binding-like beta-propeller repeat protein [Candidatus Bathyarchaeota archaeon]|nr:PQQ-binding-like beta-propeller repeat protein [Candidatus Bathyarchaeota archaeon]
MQKIKVKMATIAISLILVTSMFAILSNMGTTSAHTPAWEIPTYAKLGFSSNPIGVGQTTLIYMFLGNPPFPNAALTNDYRFRNYRLTITAPDGTVETHNFDYIADSTNAQTYSFTPQQTGAYNINFTFLGQAVNDYSHNPTSPFVNDTYLPSSTVATLTVQEEPLPDPIYSYPLPTEYWTRPIEGQNSYWYTISSHWLGSGAPGYGGMVGPNMRVFPGDAVGPETAHVMWTKPIQSGGVVGGDLFDIQGNTYFEGSAYIQRFTNPIIVNGKLYYRAPLSFPGGTTGPTYCVDIRTGEVVWSRTDLPSLSFAYIYDVENPQQHGVYQPILCTSNFGQCFDADTGEPLFNATGVPSGTTVLGPQGEHLRYVIAAANPTNVENPDWRLAQWNSSKMWTGLGFGSGTGTRPEISGTVDASTSNRYDWNISLPCLNEMPQRLSGSSVANPISVVQAFYNDILLCREGSLPSTNADPSIRNPYTYFAINLDETRGAVGRVLWRSTVTPPENIQIISYAGADPEARVFVESYRQTSNFVGYSMDTGKKLWGPTESQDDFDYFGSPGPGTLANVVAYGKLYSSAYAGILYCYDLATGQRLWTYGNGGEGNSTFGGLGVYYNHYPTFINAIGNDVVYLVTTEHTIETPIFKGALTRAVNATDGTEIWTLPAFVGEFAASSFAIADGFALYFNGYDNQVYSVGRGPSALTVEAPLANIALGSGLVIRGSVTDVSAGTTQDEQAARFPNGVPVASDESMTEWMAYVYQQKPKPTEFTGVTVELFVLDANNNYRSIGTTTTDSNGFYSLNWTPDISGKYTVYAQFAGSKAYWPSQATTAFAVDDVEATTGPTETPPSMVEQYFLPAVIAIIIAIIVGFAVLALLVLRKRD